MQAAIESGNYQMALEWAELILARYPSHPETLRAKGSILLLVGDDHLNLGGATRCQITRQQPAHFPGLGSGSLALLCLLVQGLGYRGPATFFCQPPDYDSHLLYTAGNLQAIAYLHTTRRFYPMAVEMHLATLDCLRGLLAVLEETRCP